MSAPLRLAELARQHGWTARVTTARGTPLDAAGEPVRATEAVPLYGEDGRVLTTEKGRARFTRVRTEALVIEESVVVWLDRNGRRIKACWRDGKFIKAWSWPPALAYGSAELGRVVAEDPAQWQSLSAEMAMRCIGHDHAPGV